MFFLRNVSPLWSPCWSAKGCAVAYRCNFASRILEFQLEVILKLSTTILGQSLLDLQVQIVKQFILFWDQGWRNCGAKARPERDFGRTPSTISIGRKTFEGKGAFFLTGLNEILRAKGVSHLIVCGVTTEAWRLFVFKRCSATSPVMFSLRQVCVQTTMREANDRGYECVLVEDLSVWRCSASSSQ